MEGEVGWREKFIQKELMKREEEEGGKADASLWSPVCRSRHPLLVPLFLMLQPGVSHRVSLFA